MRTIQHPTFNHDASENVAYNTPTFPVYIREGLLSFFPNYSANPHWHEDLEFMLILSGQMTYNVNGELTQLSAGNGIFVNSRHLHYGFSAEKNDCHFICFLLHPALLSANPYFSGKYVEPFIRNTECPYLHLNHTITWHQEILSLLKEMFQTMNSEMSPFITQRHFFRIIELLYTNHAPNSLISGKSAVDFNGLKDMILYIHEHYAEDITLHDIARSGSCCKSKCTGLFKQYLKESPVLFLNHYRLKIACDLLRDTDLPVTEIALECGYHGSSYFCETFNKQYDTTPLQYRELHRQYQKYLASTEVPLPTAEFL